MTARRATRSARPSVIAISLSTATTAVSRKIRDSSEHGEDHEAGTRDPIRPGNRQDSPFPVRILSISSDMLPAEKRSRSDSALYLLMLVSYALSIIRRTAAHYADVSHGGRVERMKKTRRGLYVFVFPFFLSFFLVLIIYIVSTNCMLRVVVVV